MSSPLLDSNTTVTVIVLEGEHSLDTQFSVERIMTFSMSSSHINVDITCKNSTALHLYNIGYVCLYNLEFRRCQFAVRRVDNLLLLNVEIIISDPTITITAALWLLQTNAMIFNSFFCRITSDFGAVGGIIGANQCNMTMETIIFEACRAYDGIALLSGQDNFKELVISEYYLSKKWVIQ